MNVILYLYHLFRKVKRAFFNARFTARSVIVRPVLLPVDGHITHPPPLPFFGFPAYFLGVVPVRFLNAFEK